MASEATLIKLALDAFATRYLSASGLVILLFDHALTFSDEVDLVWKSSRRSFSKYAFLTNRYLVPVVLLALAVSMCGFVRFSDAACRYLIVVSAVLGIISIGMANILILLQVVWLWDKNRTVRNLLAGGFILSFSATSVFMFVALHKLFDGIRYSSLVHMCSSTTQTRALIVVWASPMLFEALVLVLTLWNSVDRPRHEQTTLTRVLLNDGIAFFFILSLLRAMNLIFAAVGSVSKSMMSICFVWAMITVTLNRCILHSLRARLVDHYPVHCESEFVHSDSIFQRSDVPLDLIIVELKKTRSGSDSYTSGWFDNK